MEPPLIIACVLATALVIGSLIASYRSQKKRRLLEALPTSATQGVFIGLVELKGTAESSAPLATFLAEAAAECQRAVGALGDRELHRQQGPTENAPRAQERMVYGGIRWRIPTILPER